ncbi:MAG: LapA family protein [Armatimonadetes bacterium]|nr:LapA family protein [Armatimonadota bacterium]
MSARKPGFFGRLAEQAGEALSGLKLPKMDINTISYGLLALIALALIIENWAPVRVNIFGFYADLPKALVFIVGMGLGALVLWWVQRYRLSRREAKEQ